MSFHPGEFIGDSTDEGKKCELRLSSRVPCVFSLLVGSEISMIARVTVRPVIEGKKGVVGVPELGDNVLETLFHYVPFLLVVGV